ncbi:hypothetical protein AQUCO_05000029v1 [Aquilegia coerulea]|uniref:VQ domain-containing protein n=1 Tax=Aquilegia coerulea TaxID=218851 RepID=A0A2G5CJK9_AQUCA|nr:hypothetical protein AQUCO_05000029v1 [Aquilegia coerulea]
MEKSCSSNQSDNNNNHHQHQHHQYLKQVNKTSHKISKPIIIRKTPPLPFDHSQQPLPQQQDEQQQQNQPPVYNINKSDFREVVQKLTGSPAHERFLNQSQPPPNQFSNKPQTSRLQRIRPPPLAHLSTGPSSSLNNVIHLPPIFNPNYNFNNNGNGRSISPLSPFPTVHAAVESPISAYMKYL